MERREDQRRQREGQWRVREEARRPREEALLVLEEVRLRPAARLLLLAVLLHPLEDPLPAQAALPLLLVALLLRQVDRPLLLEEALHPLADLLLLLEEAQHQPVALQQTPVARAATAEGCRRTVVVSLQRVNLRQAVQGTRLCVCADLFPVLFYFFSFCVRQRW